MPGGGDRTHTLEQAAGGQRPRRVASRRGGGFTLLETALATVIIGVGVLALIEAQAAFTRSNDVSTSAATGTYLASELRERLRSLDRHDPQNGLYFLAEGGATTLRGWGPEEDETELADFDDLDDYDGLTFGAGGDLPGPIDANGQVIQEIDALGGAVVDGEGAAVSLRGWRQEVVVEKIDPLNFATVRDDAFFRAPVPPNDPGLGVDGFPLRVTITVTYRPPGELDDREMARIVFIKP